MSPSENSIRRAYFSIRAVFSILLLMCVFSQDISSEEIRTGSETIKIFIPNFEKLEGDTRVDGLETTLPHLFRAGLFQYDWLEVILANELKGAGVESGITPQKQPNLASLTAQNVKYTLEGTIIQITDKIRVDISLTDVTDNSTIFSDFVLLDKVTILTSVDQFAKSFVSRIAPVVTEPPSKEIRFVIVQPFNNKSRDKKYDFLETVLSGSILSRLSEVNMKNVSFLDVSSEETEQPDIDAQVMGEYTIDHDKLVVSAKIIERSDLTFPIQIDALLDAPDSILDLPGTLSDRILEVIKGRITPQGKWKEEPILSDEPTVEEYVAQGEKYYQSKDYDSAILMYRKALEQKPDEINAHLRLADIYMAQKKYKNALSEYRYVVERDNSNPAGHYGLGMAYFNTSQYNIAIDKFEQALKFASNDQIRFDAYKGLGDAYFMQGQNEDAVENYRLAEEIDDTNPEFYRSWGRIYLANGNASGLLLYLLKDNLDEAVRHFKTAIEYFEKGMRLSPEAAEFKKDLASTYNTMGRMYYRAKRYDESRTAFSQTIELNPEADKLKAEAYRYAGVIVAFYSKNKDIKMGIEYLEKSISLDLNNEPIYRDLGDAYQLDRQYDKAIETLERALKIKETYQTYYRISVNYREKEEYELAKENVNKALGLNPKFARGYAELGAIYQLLGNDDEAIKNLNKAIALDPKDKWAYEMLGFTYRNKEEYDRAIEYLDRAIEMQPTPWAYTELGETYRLKGNYSHAIEALQKALELDPRYEDAYTILETIYEETSEYGTFMEVLQEAVTRDPDYYWTQTQLGVAYGDARKYDQAIEHLNKAISLNSNDEWAYAELGEIYRLTKDYSQAIEALQKALELDPRYENAYTTLETIYTETKRIWKISGDLGKSHRKGSKVLLGLCKIGHWL